LPPSNGVKPGFLVDFFFLKCQALFRQRDNCLICIGIFGVETLYLPNIGWQKKKSTEVKTTK
jgi:hypothetical protein